MVEYESPISEDPTEQETAADTPYLSDDESRQGERERAVDLAQTYVTEHPGDTHANNALERMKAMLEEDRTARGIEPTPGETG